MFGNCNCGASFRQELQRSMECRYWIAGGVNDCVEGPPGVCGLPLPGLRAKWAARTRRYEALATAEIFVAHTASAANSEENSLASSARGAEHTASSIKSMISLEP